MTRIERKTPPSASGDAPAAGVKLFAPAKPRRTFEEIINQIKVLLETGVLKQGDKLPSERELAMQFEVSRNTVREALRTLEISGYVTLKRGAGGGAFVVETDPQALNGYLSGALKLTDFSIDDLTTAMRAFSIMLIDLSATTIGEADIRAMEDNLRQARAIVDSPAERSRVLVQFYRLLAEATGNKILVAMSEVLVELLYGWVRRLGSLNSETIFASRQKIIDCLRQDDRGGAQRELESYLAQLHDRWLRG